MGEVGQALDTGLGTWRPPAPREMPESVIAVKGQVFRTFS